MHLNSGKMRRNGKKSTKTKAGDLCLEILKITYKQVQRKQAYTEKIRTGTL
jgi:hypothetical protein